MQRFQLQGLQADVRRVLQRRRRQGRRDAGDAVQLQDQRLRQVYLSRSDSNPASLTSLGARFFAM